MYIQSLEYKDIYHDVMRYATVTWRARKATDDGKTNRKQKTSSEKKRKAKKKKQERTRRSVTRST